MEQESIYDWLWLLLVFGAGSRKIWKLLEQYETPQKVRQVLQTETDLPFIHEREQRSIRSITNEQIGKLIQNCAEKRIELVAYDDENYPESLRQIYNPPVVLFYQGQLSVLSDYPALTVVGTRKPSSYSIRTADLLCRCLAKSGMLLVSGFAVGLDSVAHRAALQNSPVSFHAANRLFFTSAFLSSDISVDFPSLPVAFVENSTYCIFFCAASSSDTFVSTSAVMAVSIFF